jgi:hypothetical protein
MTEAQVELAKRAVACKGWKWMPGMLASLRGIDGDYRARVCRVEGDKFWSDATTLPVTRRWQVDLRHAMYDLASYVPDLTDPATLGCLLALVREAWGDPTLHVVCAGGSVELGVWHARWGTSSRRGATEAEALVAALEAAP